MNSSNFENLPSGQFLDVTVSLNGKVKTRNLKVCRVKARSLLFINVDKENRLNTFFKVKYTDIKEYLPAVGLLRMKDGVLPDKWESAWDSIGQPTTPFPHKPGYGRVTFSNHSQGWAPKLPSTTNSAAGFPMV